MKKISGSAPFRERMNHQTLLRERNDIYDEHRSEPQSNQHTEHPEHTIQPTSNPSYQSEYHWQGSSYSYHPQQSTPYYASISKPVKTPEQKKKSRKAGKIVAAIAAVLVCCAIVSGGTLAAFIGLINHGTITLRTPAQKQILPIPLRN